MDAITVIDSSDDESSKPTKKVNIKQYNKSTLVLSIIFSRLNIALRSANYSPRGKCIKSRTKTANYHKHRRMHFDFNKKEKM